MSERRHRLRAIKARGRGYSKSVRSFADIHGMLRLGLKAEAVLQEVTRNYHNVIDLSITGKCAPHNLLDVRGIAPFQPVLVTRFLRLVDRVPRVSKWQIG